MILCHKCSGLLANSESEDVAGLRDCRCISGYVRGFEPVLNRAQAIDVQIDRTIERIELYERQGRNEQYLDPEWKVLGQLMLLKEGN
jgi:hypothetical protein